MRGTNERTAILRDIRFHPLAEKDLDRIDETLKRSIAK
jgi:hypothetical protein